MRYRVRYNPNWLQNEGARCYLCKETRSVKYFGDAISDDGKLTVVHDLCNRCAPAWWTLNEKGGLKYDRT